MVIYVIISILWKIGYIFSFSFEPYSKLGYIRRSRYYEKGCLIQLPDKYLQRKWCGLDTGPVVYNWISQKILFWNDSQYGTVQYFETSTSENVEEIVEKKLLETNKTIIEKFEAIYLSFTPGSDFIVIGQPNVSDNHLCLSFNMKDYLDLETDHGYNPSLFFGTENSTTFIYTHHQRGIGNTQELYFSYYDLKSE